MTRTWVYSDPHFYHKNIVTFTNYDGTKVRPWDDADTMTEDMIAWYNDIVADNDRVYILGDVAFTASTMKRAASQLKGRKVLVPGNHDPTKIRRYAEFFDDIRGYVVKPDFVMSHMPIHVQSLSRWKLNIHGHLHNNTVKLPAVNPRVLTQLDDKRYYCACVERTNFRPKLLDEILHESGLR